MADWQYVDAGETANPHIAETKWRGQLDLDHVLRQSLGDSGLADEILRLYADMSRSWLDKIEASTSVSQLVDSLQVLTTAAAGIGAVRVKTIAGETLRDLRTGHPVDPERISDIAMAVEETNAYIDELLFSPAS